MPEFFDIHSHINFSEFETDREELISNMSKEQIWTITIGTDSTSSKSAVDLAEKNEGIFACIGLHPIDNVSQHFDKKSFEMLINSPKVVAIGECGLDYFRLKNSGEDEKRRQKSSFEQQIEFAVNHDKPLMIHCREAYSDVLDILNSKKKAYGQKLRGNFHFFTSPIEIARQCLDLGFTVSFTGPITYTDQYDAVVEYVPIDCMMTETDAPFAAPMPYRGKRNNPLYVKEIVRKIADIKRLTYDQVKKKMVENALRIFIKKG